MKSGGELEGELVQFFSFPFFQQEEGDKGDDGIPIKDQVCIAVHRLLYQDRQCPAYLPPQANRASTPQLDRLLYVEFGIRDRSIYSSVAAIEHVADFKKD
jgi:hypothetical protein